VPCTIDNVQHLLKTYGIHVRYNVIKKKTLINIPFLQGSPDNFDNSALTQIISLANLNDIQIGQLSYIVEAIADRNQFNPVAEWINAKPWDKTDRLPDLYRTLEHREGFPPELKELLIHRWLLSAVAAALSPTGFRSRGVLTIQGPQSIGKTAWTQALVSDPSLRRDVIKVDHPLDAGNKDSQLSAIAHWIVEIGELDGAFRKDVARLKGFLTADSDKVRRPYGRVESEYQRRTVFCATVNDETFLVDPTGNTRWWTIPVTKIDYLHKIDMQQVFAQLAEEFHAGERWWLTADEEALLELHNSAHRSVSVLRERILDRLDLDRKGDGNLPAMTPTELLATIGIGHPSNSQCKECGQVLREILGVSKRIRGRDKWRIPLRDDQFPHSDTVVDDDDLY
jgi:putative DNA primase/helicase